MASIFSSLISMFSGGGSKSGASPSAVSADPKPYGDCTIYPEPMKEGAQYRLAGRITKTVGDQVLTRSFIRADLFSTADEAVEFTIRKAEQIIDQNGASLFADGAAQRQV
ncbi:HlyU family transcriptional regulator [Oryzifoliimicrobium ureilyticus]|uniref:HlyU family transcriptional regulator n=1 Tax=Oryzifoliimicrobium ureilyticus TaxID=3113724 RepID=UPI0030767489